MARIAKTTYRFKKENINESSTNQSNASTQHLADLTFDPVDPLNILSSYYQNHQAAEPIDAIRHTQAEVPQLNEKKEIKEAKDYIEQHLHRTITLNEMAQKVFLSPYYFSKLFKAETGITFIAYVNQQKMRQASQLLCESHLSINQIAKGLGFTQMSYFSRMFKKEYGVTPKDYRRSYSS
ncbi:helix-turn-helix domain-containing protein [Isobaculum melis]|uniref:AraC-type DNA-binding protein n=1 Tax=Isobaculum melis TaxID=142588 RepID=A0A1H9U4Y5_9LACT|nr:AraC family transcriptional regulator [Isobaculum melis]SES04429.1 AraC-type DNA-binding protein [Isobaculum melis]